MRLYKCLSYFVDQLSYRCTEGEIHRQTDGHTDRSTDRQMEGRTDRQTYLQTERQREMCVRESEREGETDNETERVIEREREGWREVGLGCVGWAVKGRISRLLLFNSLYSLTTCSFHTNDCI